YAAHQINLQPRVSLPETTPTLRWTGKVGDASVFRVWGSRAFVRDTTADKLSSRAVPCVFLGFPPDAPWWQFYHPTSRCVLSFQDVTFDESVSYYHPAEPVEVAVDSGAARGAEPGGAESGGAKTGGAEHGGVALEGTVFGGAEPARVAGTLGAVELLLVLVLLVLALLEVLLVLELLELLEVLLEVLLVLELLEVLVLVLVLLEVRQGLETLGLRVPVLSLLFLEALCGRSQLHPASPLPGPSPYSGPTRGLTERREPESRPVSPESRPASPARTVRAGRASRPRLPPVLGTHYMTLHPSTAPQRVLLPSPPVSSLPDGPDPEYDSHRATSPTVTRFLATAVSDPLFESSAASALVAELVDFAASCRLEYAASLVAESVSASVCPPSVGVRLGCTRHPDPALLQEAIEGPYSSQWQAAMDAEMTTLRVLLHVAAQRDYELHSLDFSTAFLQGSLHKEIWLRRPPGFTGTTLAALGFAPSTSDPSLFLRTDATLPPFYVLVYVDDLVFATADTEALAHVKSELEKRHTCTDLGELTSYLGLRITQDRAQRTITLTQSHMVQQVLQRFGFTYSSPQSTPLPTGHSLSAPPSDESLEPSGPYPELVGCLITSGMGLVLGGRARVVLTGHADASWVDDLGIQRSSQGSRAFV
ncbi:unnamed protein product, partial [Closterium sp. NIES-53]